MQEVGLIVHRLSEGSGKLVNNQACRSTSCQPCVKPHLLLLRPGDCAGCSRSGEGG